MLVLDWCRTNELAVKQVGKVAVYISNGLAYDDSQDNAIWKFVQDSMKAQYGDGTTEFYDVMGHLVNGGLFFFETKEEQMAFYQVFEQTLTDSSAIYACTYDESGQSITENT